MTTTDKQSMVTAADWVPGPRQGSWTYSHYAALPDDGARYEIANGVLYMAPAPNLYHQEIAGEIFAHLRTYLQTTGLGRAFIAPVDVELSPGDVFQPDVLVLLQASRYKEHTQRIIGAPDLVVEVASPKTAPFDRQQKYERYAYNGIPEYWIVDPRNRIVELLVLEAGQYYSLGVFSSPVTLPSRILPGLPTRVEQFFSWGLPGA
jgi:Uma2 family endonuclease